MKVISAVACLLLCGSLFADEPKVEIKKKPVDIKIIVQPKIGQPLPNIRPHAGQHYWRHPTYGWGYWYYPAPAVPAPQNYYLDQFGRVVPNGYTYDGNGNLVPLPVAPVYQYRWWGGWWRR